MDCSGLTRAVCRLNGLSIPRVSREQYKAGRFVYKQDLQNRIKKNISSLIESPSL
ncbi:MAG: C40 family peptidase [Mucispirillum sp.]|nr:C40 family peptidase [Mucispirillum sp.]